MDRVRNFRLNELAHGASPLALHSLGSLRSRVPLDGKTLRHDGELEFAVPTRSSRALRSNRLVCDTDREDEHGEGRHGAGDVHGDFTLGHAPFHAS
jgi:hypothetical protein